MQNILLVKHVETIPQETAHLYEHMFINSFFIYVEKKLGINPKVIGYLGGETYRDIIFVEAIFYDDAVADLLETFLASRISCVASLDVCSKQCAAEDRETWRITDRGLLMEQLEALHAAPWLREEEIMPQIYTGDGKKEASPIKIQKSAKHYKSVLVTLTLNPEWVEDRAVFLRFHVILNDIISRCVEKNGWYVLDALFVKDEPTYMYCGIGVVLPRGVTTNQLIRTAIEDVLSSFDFGTNQHYLDAHFKEFGSQPRFIGRMRNNLHFSDVLASNKMIAALATPDRLQRITQTLSVKVETVSFDHAKYLS